MDTNNQTIAISKETVATMPMVEYDGGITVVDTPELARVALRELTRARVVGFDTETRPSFHRGRLYNVALMQLSTDDHCYLFRLNILGITDGLRRFLEDPEIIKIGLSVHDDFSVMRRLYPDLDPQGFIDLQEYVKYFHISDISLQKIYAIVFQHRISKTQRLTNWEAPQLTPAQQLYAAIDAWACLKLYRRLRSGQFDPHSSPFIVDRSILNNNGQIPSTAKV
ncbi:MAG: 3'-5' exonuclease domain-containing protein 2 [Muribaculaceae bacterium]|nr:3'-5' exonuclease domain-containing protein 2 [Muribaculaceae bacterium]